MKRDSEHSDEFEQENVGGPKKFLYTGSNKKQRVPGFERNSDEWTFVDTNTRNNNKHNDLDLDGVWSIKKNVVVTKPATTSPRTGMDDLSLNMNKNFYSRHGGLSDVNQASTELQYNGASGPKTWGQGKSYSYSYSNNAQSPRQSHNSNQNNLTGGASYGARDSGSQFSSNSNSRYLDF